MNEQHFICQLCKDKKNIIFYKEIEQLLEHYRSLHHVCPYQECLEDMFVVFDTEEKLNSHLFTKHKCVDAQNRIASFHFDEKKVKSSKGNKSCIRDEFNFTEYVNKLKDRVKDYIKNFSNRKKSEEHNYQEYFDESQRRGRRDNKNKKNNDYYGYDEEYAESYGNEYQNSQYQTGYYDNTYQNNTRKGKNKFNQNQDNVYYENQNISYSNRSQDVFDQAIQQNLEIYPPKQSYKEKRGTKGTNKNDYSHNNYYKEKSQYQNSQVYQVQPPSKQNNTINPIKIDYSFIFNSVVKIIKEFITIKIKNENPAEEEFILPQEIIYQLIVIIDKLDQDKLLELNSLNNFGIDLDVFKEMKKLLSKATLDGKFTDSFNKQLDKLEIRKLLISYKYLTTAQKKIDGLFYKLGKFLLI
jgi:hypothetical protein